MDTRIKVLRTMVRDDAWDCSGETTHLLFHLCSLGTLVLFFLKGLERQKGVQITISGSAEILIQLVQTANKRTVHFSIDDLPPQIDKRRQSGKFTNRTVRALYSFGMPVGLGVECDRYLQLERTLASSAPYDRKERNAEGSGPAGLDQNLTYSEHFKL